MKKLNMSCDYSLSSTWKGKSWKDWITKLNIENLLKEKDKKQQHRKHSESVRTLPRKDILLHGQYPKEEVSELCSCEKCGKVMMTQSYLIHLETRHGPGNQQQQDTSKVIVDVKKKSKPSKSKKKTTNTLVPQSTGFSEQNVANDNAAVSNKGKSVDTTLENVKKTSSSKPSSSSHSLNKKRSKSKNDDHSLKNSEDRKLKDSGDSPLKNSVDCKSSKDLDTNSRFEHTKDTTAEDRTHIKLEKRSFCCEKCGKVFDSQDLLLCHQKHKHMSSSSTSSSSSSNSKHGVLHNSKSSSNKKKSNSTSSKSSSSSSSSNTKRVERTGTKPYTDLVSDLSSLINHKGKTWVDLSIAINNNKSPIKNKDNADYHTVRGLLPRVETKLFGDFPKVDSRILSYCEKCSQVVLSHEIESHLKYYHNPENCLNQTSPPTVTLSPNSIKKKNAHLKNRKKPLLSSSLAVSPVVTSKSAPSSPPSPLQASNEISPPVMPAVQINKISSLSTSNSSSPTTPPSSPSRHKKLKKDNKYNKVADSSVYYDPDKHANNAIGKSICLRPIKTNEAVKMAASTPQVQLKGAVENRVSPPVQVVKPFMPQSQMQPSRSVSPSALMPPPPSPTTTTAQSSKHKKLKKNKKPKEPLETEPKEAADNSDSSKGPCLRPVRSNSVVRVQQRRIIVNKKDNGKVMPAVKLPKEMEVEPSPPVKSSVGLSVPKLLDDDDELPVVNDICTTTSQQTVNSQITSAKFMSSAFVKIAPATTANNLTMPSMPQLFAPNLTSSLNTSMTPIIPITLSNTMETTLPPALSPTLSTTLPAVLSPSFSSNTGMSMPTLQTIQTNSQPSVPSILDPIVQIAPEIQQFSATVQPTITQPIDPIQPIQSTIPVQTIQPTSPNVQPIQTTASNMQPIQTTTPTVQPIQSIIPSIQPIQTALQTALQPNIQTIQSTIHPTSHQSTILTTLQSTLQPAVQQTVQPGIQPMQLAIAPTTMSPGEAFIPAISPSQLVILPMSPVSVVSPIQDKTNKINTPPAPKHSSKPSSDRISVNKKGNLISILRKNNENLGTEKTVELINPSSHAQTYSTVGQKASNMVSILRKPPQAMASTDEQPEKLTFKSYNAPSKSTNISKTGEKLHTSSENKFVQFNGSLIRMASQPFLNPEPIFLTVPIPNANSSVYTPHPKPLNSGLINGGVLKRHGVAVSSHRAAARVEFLRSEIQQATISRRPIGNSCTLLNSHHRPNILKQPRNHVRTAGIKRNATERIGNDSKQIRLASDVNGFILHTDVSEAAEAPQPTNSVTFLNMK